MSVTCWTSASAYELWEWSSTRMACWPNPLSACAVAWAGWHAPRCPTSRARLYETETALTALETSRDECRSKRVLVCPRGPSSMLGLRRGDDLVPRAHVR